MALIKPMLAAEGVLGNITYPKLVSAKLNGVRGFNPSGSLVSRTLKPIPNLHTRAKFSGQAFAGLDGELVVGHFGDPSVFSRSTSGVMSHKGEPDVKWYVFDIIDTTLPFSERCKLLEKRVKALPAWMDVVLVPHRIINSDEELVAFHDECVELGYEGVVIRNMDDMYKLGRSTEKEQGFMRFVLWHRSECEILSVLEEKTNTNEATKNELGRTKRSSSKAGMVGSGTAGSALVRDIHTNQEFGVPLGTDEECEAVWSNIENFIGKIYTYKFRTPVKPGGLPRFPGLEGERHKDDLGEVE